MSTPTLPFYLDLAAHAERASTVPNGHRATRGVFSSSSPGPSSPPTWMATAEQPPGDDSDQTSQTVAVFTVDVALQLLQVIASLCMLDSLELLRIDSARALTDRLAGRGFGWGKSTAPAPIHACRS